MTDTLETRLARAAAARLGRPVSFVRWIRRATGDVPVFAVPADAVEQARALGLTTEASDAC